MTSTSKRLILRVEGRRDIRETCGKRPKRVGRTCSEMHTATRSDPIKCRSHACVDPFVTFLKHLIACTKAMALRLELPWPLPSPFTTHTWPTVRLSPLQCRIRHRAERVHRKRLGKLTQGMLRVTSGCGHWPLVLFLAICLTTGRANYVITAHELVPEGSCLWDVKLHMVSCCNCPPTHRECLGS